MCLDLEWYYLLAKPTLGKLVEPDILLPLHSRVWVLQLYTLPTAMLHLLLAV
jgi:hypothetical protein